MQNSAVYPQCYCRSSYTGPRGSVSPQTVLRGSVSSQTVLRGRVRSALSYSGWARPHDFDSLSNCDKTWKKLSTYEVPLDAHSAPVSCALRRVWADCELFLDDSFSTLYLWFVTGAFKVLSFSVKLGGITANKLVIYIFLAFNCIDTSLQYCCSVIVVCLLIPSLVREGWTRFG